MMFTNVRIRIVNRIPISSKFPFLYFYCSGIPLPHQHSNCDTASDVCIYRTVFYQNVLLLKTLWLPQNDNRDAESLSIQWSQWAQDIDPSLFSAPYKSLTYCCIVNWLDFILNNCGILFLLQYSWYSWSLSSVWHWI